MICRVMLNRQGDQAFWEILNQTKNISAKSMSQSEDKENFMEDFLE